MMDKLYTLYNHTDKWLTTWMSRYGILLLRISLGIVFLWFGILKFFPGLSPAEDLAVRTINQLTFGLLPSELTLGLLATWESLIGLGLIFGVGMRFTLLLLFTQMVGTISPVFLFPGEVFVLFPLVPTLEGQYIIKNLVIISAGIVIGATVRGGFLVPEPTTTPSKPEAIQNQRV